MGLQGYSSLNQLGTGAFTGFISAYLNTREIAPLVAGLALAATVGCGFTAQLGAMRISEEVDALEVMGILAALPRHDPDDRRLHRRDPALRPRTAVVLRRDALHRHGVLRAVQGHLRPLLPPVPPPVDVFYSFLKVMVFAVVIILIHCYYGYTASGGPAGVGVAVGKAVRTSIVAINIVDFFFSLAVWGASTTVRIAG